MVSRHHTKDRGDLGVAKVHADLAGSGHAILFPVTEHSAFDLVAYKAGAFVRVQVKYRSARAGALTVHFRSLWADRHGTHTSPMDKSEVDVVAIYCPDTDGCYYVRPSEHGQSITIRVLPARNNQARGVIHGSALRTLPE